MSQELTTEYQSLLDEYVGIRNRASEIRTRIAAIHRELFERTKANTIPKLVVESRVCTYCGSTDYYAKRYCRSCYNRAQRNGTPEPKPRGERTPKPKTKTQLWAEKDWKDKIYRNVFGFDRPYDEPIPTDYEESVYFALDMLSEREKQIMIYRYIDGLTYQEIGDKIGTTRERPRQIEHKSLRKLRHPKRACYLQNGIARQREIESEKEKEKQELIQRKEKEREAELGRCNLHISEFELSVRAYNCLARAGFTDRNSVMKFIADNDGDADALNKIRDCGRKTIIEIIEKLHIPV